MDCTSSVSSPSWAERWWVEVSRLVSVSLKALEEATFVAQSNFGKAETEVWTVYSLHSIQMGHQQRITLKSSSDDQQIKSLKFLLKIIFRKFTIK
jgi:hypothetical protein